MDFLNLWKRIPPALSFQTDDALAVRWSCNIDQPSIACTFYAKSHWSIAKKKFVFIFLKILLLLFTSWQLAGASGQLLSMTDLGSCLDKRMRYWYRTKERNFLLASLAVWLRAMNPFRNPRNTVVAQRRFLAWRTAKKRRTQAYIHER